MTSGGTADWSADLTTRSELTIHVRPVREDDEAAVSDFFEHVTPEDLHFRFLGGIREVSHDRLVSMTHVDHRQTENFIAVAEGGKSIIATAMLACDVGLHTGEVAISVRAEYKHMGVSWELLQHVARYAEARGIKTLQSIESCQNDEAIALQQEQGFTAESHPDDATLLLVRKELRRT